MNSILKNKAQSFGPIAGPDATRLVLGTIPGKQSLEKGQYYAHSRNAFWFIIESLFSNQPIPDYAFRTKLLTRSKIALWDVLKEADRQGSSDSAIVLESIVVNDFNWFFSKHPYVEHVFFNGKNAEKLFKKHVLPFICLDRQLNFTCLPSTSPANARLTLEEKLSAWMLLTSFSE